MSILATDDFGQDEGVICNLEYTVNTILGKQVRECGGNTFLIDDQGGGLKTYRCEKCGGTFLVQYDSCEDEEEPYEEMDFPSDYY